MRWTILFLLVACPLAAAQDEPVATEVRIVSSGSEVCFNIYGETPYMDPSSRYVIYVRAPGALEAEKEKKRVNDNEVWRADLETGKTQKIGDTSVGIRGMGASPDQRHFYYIDAAESQPVVEVEIATLRRRVIEVEGGPWRFRTLSGVTPDQRFFVASVTLAPTKFGIAKVDLKTGKFKIIHEGGPDIFNAHVQVEPGEGKEVLIQHNRGAQIDETGKVLRSYGPEGTTLFTIGIDGGILRRLPIGRPHTTTIQGHEAWVGKTRAVLFTTHWGTLQNRAENGNVWVIGPEEEKPRIIAKGYTFWHVNASRCGRYFLADTRGGRVVPDPDSKDGYKRLDVDGGGVIIVGSIRTGRYRVVCVTQAACASAQYSHPHPYLSPDSKWAVFNSEKDGVPHVAAARIPDGLLEDLDK